MKKRTGIIFGIIIIVIIFFSFGYRRYMISKEHDGKVFGDEYYESIELLNDELKTHMYLYGDDIVFDTDVEYTKLKDLSQLVVSKEDDYTILIVNDDKTNYNIGDEQWLQIKNLLENNSHFFFYYYGTRSQKSLISNGIFDNNTFLDGDLCTGRVLKNGESWSSCGVVEESNLHVGNNKIADKYRPGQFIIENIGYYIKSNY